MAGDPSQPAVLVRGSADVGSAVAHRLFRAGFGVVLCDVALPSAPRRGMAFADAIFDGDCALDGLQARRVDVVDDLAAAIVARAAIPGLHGRAHGRARGRRAVALVDARMRTRATPSASAASRR